ncbi:FecCD family ABC transporter permease [Rugamonas sp. CCM 8940]|uniref:FecCD family ABC transporter permease n=1 Tax=Rugamonas sp. CCM 8940 TaxID=2765359 RepID=UPI0018F59866|nr:iron ABC transporter permease [Rugamonas sp. CCM 8940]MBJ7312500.1 iron ABC transporter permease [Rugamonas sp. CCM 8940]
MSAGTSAGIGAGGKADGGSSWVAPAFAGVTLVVLLAAAVGGLLLGAIDIGVGQVWAVLLQHAGAAVGAVASDFAGDTAGEVVWSLRAPRVVVGALAGACMAVSGALMQGMTRNPLADPTLTGVAAGAACAIVAAQTCWPALAPQWHAPLGIAGGVVAAGLAFALAWRERLAPTQLALAGLAVTAFATAGITTLLVLSGPDAASLFFWLSGGLAGRGWEHVELLWPWAAAGMALAWLCAPALDVMALGDEAAHGLGLHLTRWRLACGAAAVALAAAAVAVAGPFGFVGLCTPHIARLCLGNGHRSLLLGAAGCGAALVCVADLLARSVAAPRELPAGFVTALIAAPLLIGVLRKGRAA